MSKPWTVLRKSPCIRFSGKQQYSVVGKVEWFLSGDNEATLGLVRAQTVSLVAVMPEATWLFGRGEIMWAVVVIWCAPKGLARRNSSSPFLMHII